MYSSVCVELQLQTTSWRGAASAVTSVNVGVLVTTTAAAPGHSARKGHGGQSQLWPQLLNSSGSGLSSNAVPRLRSLAVLGRKAAYVRAMRARPNSRVHLSMVISVSESPCLI